MRRLIQTREGERGAISVIVALLMVVLLGMAALVIDVGIMYAEKAQLQNGADAAALAIAQECARDPLCSASSIAEIYANDNANDGASNVQSVELLPDTNSVTVTTGAEEIGGDENSVSLYFADALCLKAANPSCDFSSAKIGAVAGAEWGSPVGGPAVLPLTFSECQFTIPGPQVIFYKGNSDLGAGDCHSGAGHIIPGGFGWLDLSEFAADGDPCGVTIDSDSPVVGTNPGNSMPGNCTNLLTEWVAALEAGELVTALLPVFDDTNGTGNTGEFHISGFAAFNITGWKFSGGHDWPTAYDSAGYGGDDRVIIGEFVEMISIDTAYETGGTDYDATIVRLTLGTDE